MKRKRDQTFSDHFCKQFIVSNANQIGEISLKPYETSDILAVHNRNVNPKILKHKPPKAVAPYSPSTEVLNSQKRRKLAAQRGREAMGRDRLKKTNEKNALKTIENARQTVIKVPIIQEVERVLQPTEKQEEQADLVTDEVSVLKER